MILFELILTVQRAPQCDLCFLPVSNGPSSTVLRLVFRVLDYPRPGVPCQLQAIQRSSAGLLSRSLIVHLTCLKSNGDYAKHDGDQRIQVQVPGVIWALNEDDCSVGGGKGHGLVV